MFVGFYKCSFYANGPKLPRQHPSKKHKIQHKSLGHGKIVTGQHSCVWFRQLLRIRNTGWFYKNFTKMIKTAQNHAFDPEILSQNHIT